MTLKEWRAERGLTLAAAARELGAASGRTVLNWERGICIPRPHNIARIRKATAGAVDVAGIYAAHAEAAP